VENLARRVAYVCNSSIFFVSLAAKGVTLYLGV